MLTPGFNQLTHSGAGGGLSATETQALTHLCMALGIANHLAYAARYSDDTIAAAYYSLCQALRLHWTVHNVHPNAGTDSKSQSGLLATQVGRGQSCRREDRSDDGSLSARQQSILELIASGQSNKEIARSLGISPETVKTHVTNILIKLGVERRAQAVAFAHSVGMIQHTAMYQQATGG